jgi:hypothetical protein
MPKFRRSLLARDLHWVLSTPKADEILRKIARRARRERSGPGSLAGCCAGWGDDGALVLAMALVRWLPAPRAYLAGIFSTARDDSGILVAEDFIHPVAAIGRWVLDAEGVLTREQATGHVRLVDDALDRVEVLELRSEDLDGSGLVRREKYVRRLAKLLTRELGVHETYWIP